jgi:hypothetical protein
MAIAGMQPNPEATTRSAGARSAAGWTSALLLGLVLALFFVEARTPQPQIDDAFINYQYARNLAHGHGLVFNPGEYVEGVTSILWALLVAAGIALTDQAETVGWVLGLATGAATLVATYAFARDALRPEHAWGAAVAAALVLASPPFAVWSSQGMDTPLFAAAVTTTLALAARGRMGWATLAAVVATLTRPEGALLAAVVLGLDFLRNWRRGWSGWRWVVSYAAFVVALTACRLAYYGQPLPNTFYAKVGGVPVLAGVGYTIGFLVDGAGWLVVPAVIGGIADRRLRPAALFAAAMSAYVFAIGGDAFMYFRFFMPIVPCLTVLALRGVEWTCERRPYSGIALGLLVPIAASFLIMGTLPRLVSIGLAMFAASWVAGVAARRPWIPALVAAALVVGIGARWATDGRLATSKRVRAVADAGKGNAFQDASIRRLVAKLRRESPPPRLIATGGVGRLGYYYPEVPILDILGLIDSTVARSREARTDDAFVLAGHQRSNVSYVLSRDPDVFAIPKPGDFPAVPALIAIWQHPDFQARYEWDAELDAYRRKSPSAGR